MINSMTGFADLIVADIKWEIRSLNHRYLDISLKLPEEFKALEITFRNQIKNQIARGKIDCTLIYNQQQITTDKININDSLIASLALTATAVKTTIPDAIPLSINEVLTWPGMLLPAKLNLEQLQPKLEQSLEQLLTKLNLIRQQAGSNLQEVILKKAKDIEQQLAIIKEQIPYFTSNYKDKLTTKVTELNLKLDKDRLEQEILFLLQKTDIAEEFDRLTIHVNDIKGILTNGGTIGRRMDFMLQEMNREANTIAAKSPNNLIAKAIVEIKVLIEQIREQVQNLE